MFDCVKKFIESQVEVDEKNPLEVLRTQFKYKEVRISERIFHLDSGIYMLRQALNIASGTNERIKASLMGFYRTDLLRLLYEFGNP